MKRPITALVLMLVVACAAMLSLPATARVDPGADLRFSAVGDDGIAAAPLKCKRQRDRCPISNSSGCADC
jgi:hypothetical protein